MFSGSNIECEEIKDCRASTDCKNGGMQVLIFVHNYNVYDYLMKFGRCDDFMRGKLILNFEHSQILLAKGFKILDYSLHSMSKCTTSGAVLLCGRILSKGKNGPISI